jgi:hypothetical protein
MGAVGRNFVMARFASDRLIEEIQSLYVGLLKKNGYPAITEPVLLPKQHPGETRGRGCISG